MDYRSLAVLAAVACAAALPLLPACTAPDPGAVTFVARPGATNPSDQTGDATSSGSTTSSSSGATTSSTSSSSGTTTQADPIFGTDKFSFNDPGETANGIGSPHAPPMQGKACIVAGCHLDTASKEWSAAGTIYADNKGTALPAGTQIELRIIAPDKTIFSGASFNADSDGNFWLDNSDTPLPAGCTIGIRTSTGTPKDMSIPLGAGAAGGNCSASGCHDSKMPIYLQ